MGLFNFKSNDDSEYDKYSMGFKKRKKYSKAEAAVLAPQFLKQVQESVNLINSTTNPQVFFWRYGFAIFRLIELSKMEKLIKFSGKSPAKFKIEMIETKQAAICNLIDRMSKKYEDKIISLKTQKGKVSNVAKFYAELEPYHPEMEPETINHFNNIYENLKTFINSQL